MGWLPLELIVTALLSATLAVVVMRYRWKPLLASHRQGAVSEYVHSLNTALKTVERQLGQCACGKPIVVLDIVPTAVGLSTKFQTKTVADPSTGKPIIQFRALSEASKIG